MIKKIFLLGFLTLILAACSQVDQEGEVFLFNNIFYFIQDGEQEKDKTPIVERYTEYFNSQHIQIPILKYIHHDNYEIFIGIPANASLDELAKDKNDFLDISGLKIESDSVSFYTSYEKDGYYISEYSYIFDNGSMIYLSGKTESEKIFDSLLTKAKLSERVKLK